MLYHYGFPQHVWDIVTSSRPHKPRYEFTVAERYWYLFTVHFEFQVGNWKRIGRGNLLEYIFWRKAMWSYIRRNGYSR